MYRKFVATVTFVALVGAIFYVMGVDHYTVCTPEIESPWFIPLLGAVIGFGMTDMFIYFLFYYKD